MSGKTKSRKQIGFLLGTNALTPEQKAKLKAELHSGEVKVKRGR